MRMDAVSRIQHHHRFQIEPFAQNNARQRGWQARDEFKTLHNKKGKAGESEASNGLSTHRIFISIIPVLVLPADVIENIRKMLPDGVKFTSTLL